MSNKNKNQQKNKLKPKKQIDQQAIMRLGLDQNQQKPNQNRKRLKKLKDVNPNQLILPQSQEQIDVTIRLDEQQQKYEQFGVKDDADLQRQKKENQMIKKNKNLKGNLQLDTFLTKQPKKKDIKQVKQQPKKTQLTLFEMMRMKKDQKKRKSSDQFIANDNQQSEQNDNFQVRRLLAYEKYNGSNQNEDQLLKKAIKLSMTATSKNNDENIDYPIDDKDINKRIILSNNKGRKASKSIEKQQKKDKKKQKKQQKIIKKGPLNGYVIAFTGQYQFCDKQQLIRICGQLGAQCAKSIVKKCNLLIQGSYVLNHFKQRLATPIQQTTKSKQAMQRKIPIIIHDQIDNFFKKQTGKSINQWLNKGFQELQQIYKKQQIKSKNEQVKYNAQYKDNNQFINSFKYQEQVKKNDNKITNIDKINNNKQDKNVDKNIDKNVYKNSTTNIPQNIQTKTQKRQYMDIQKSTSNQIDIRLWTQKYKPTKLSEVVGGSSQIRNLLQWLNAWQDIHVRGNKRQVKQNKGWNAGGNINSKAALLSGDPGIGKTTTARLLSQQNGYAYTQYNASDVRNKTGINLIQYDTINVNAARKHQKKTLIIMDQVDGMSSGDRGGIAAIINMIKNTKVPIICICNDRSSQKIRSLATHCLDVKFQQPNKSLVVNRVQQILRKEGGFGQQKALQQLAETFQSDMRQILSYLEVLFKTSSKKITMNLLLNRSKHSKDASVMINDSDAARKLMNRTQFKTMKVSQRTDCFFIDSDRVPLSIHQNILSSSKKGKFLLSDMRNLVEGLNGFVLGDMLDKCIRKQQEWGLMPSYGFMSCVYSTQKISESLGFPAFPAWLGKFSSQRKNKRLSKQFKDIIYPNTLCSNWRVVKSLYCPILIHELTNLLKKQQIQMAIAFMQNYNINPSVISEHLSNLLYKNKQNNPFESISSKTKSALTRMFNKKHEDSKLKVIKSGKTKAQHIKFDPVLQIMEDEDIQEPANNQEEQQEIEVKNKKPATKQAKKK